jgi:peroxiredoxin Q/BCP
MLKKGDRIPDFDLVTDRGERISPKTLKGTRAVIYFYPKDDTPGCTREACAFRDALPKFDSAKVRVYGVSADDAKSHGKFVGKYQLNFPLIADPERQAIEGFGVWVEKSMYGRSYMGIARATFAIDANGRVEQVWDKVKPDTHAEEVLAWMTGAAPAVATPVAKKTAPAKKMAASKTAPMKAAAKKVPAKKVVAKKPAARKR